VARLVFPDEGSRLAYNVIAGTMRAVDANTVVQVYTDAAGTAPADLLAHSSYPSSVVGSTVLIDAYSRLPIFYGPDAVDTLYVRIGSGPIVPVYARVDDRLDALASGADNTQFLLMHDWGM